MKGAVCLCRRRHGGLNWLGGNFLWRQSVMYLGGSVILPLCSSWLSVLYASACSLSSLFFSSRSCTSPLASLDILRSFAAKLLSPHYGDFQNAGYFHAAKISPVRGRGEIISINIRYSNFFSSRERRICWE